MRESITYMHFHQQVYIFTGIGVSTLLQSLNICNILFRHEVAIFLKH